jgi:hypothetical protein
MPEVPDISDVPENVDLNWVARHLVALRREVRRDTQSLRDEIAVLSAIVRRVDNNQTAYRDELRALFDLHRDLRVRLETLERERD